jgi:hypothetical protein
MTTPNHMGNKDMKVNLNKEAIERNNNICVFNLPDAPLLPKMISLMDSEEELMLPPASRQRQHKHEKSRVEEVGDSWHSRAGFITRDDGRGQTSGGGQGQTSGGGQGQTTSSP